MKDHAVFKEYALVETRRCRRSDNDWGPFGVLGRPRAIGIVLSICAWGLYLATLAPTVLWGDDAEFERLAFVGWPGIGPHVHLLWVILARPFTHLPFGDIAWRANFATATFAAIAVGIVFAVGWVLTGSRFGATIGALSLQCSHTFWLHAVRADAYTLYLALLALVLLTLLVWRASQRGWLLIGAAALVGLGMLAHPLILTALPGLAFFVWRSQARGNRKGHALILSGVAFVICAAPYFLSQGSAGFWLLLHSGRDILRATHALQPRDLLLWVTFLVYQFPLFLPLGVLGLTRLWRADRLAAGTLSLVFLGDVGFSLVYQVPNQYVFYLPSYLVFALWIACGFASLRDRLSTRRRPCLVGGVILLTVGMPWAIYRSVPRVLNDNHINPLSVRNLPNRDNNTFFLYPPKRGYDGARAFGETVLQDLPSRAAILADWSPLETLVYLQEVEGLRPDVLIMGYSAGTGQQVRWLLEQSMTRSVFVADVGRYYDITEIRQQFIVRPFGLVYQLVKR